ncbi:hypothetical protein [Marinomonas shanghaiensis]|uniref:hypothetical protein n=1 Tax=Marinomonas shanghaiensis TaxID=2202418 RepID=UPI000DBA5BA8|nr:hypothetical protein [Marinomonas shanghaiensis]
MSSQLNTLDHTIMGILFKSDRALSIPTISALSESPTHKVRYSIYKMMDLGFVVRRVDVGAFPLYSAVIDCPYFPPVALVAERAFLAFDDAEFSKLVADVERRANTKTLH